MFCFQFKKLFQYLVQSPPNLHPKYYSQTTQQVSLLQYLKISCGLSQEKALAACKAFKNKIPRNGDSVLTFLKSHGFSNTHIEIIITKVPRVLGADPESNLGPKIQFFKEKGLSQPELVNLFVTNPGIFTFSLENRLKPAFAFLHSLLGNDGFVIESLKRSLFLFNLDKTVMPNVSILKNCGVPSHYVLKFLNKQPRTLMLSPNRFNEIVNLVQEMGFDPATHKFMEAVHVASLSRPMWDTKFAFYRSFGCSDKEIVLAFRKHPTYISLSEEKLRRGMDFFVNELGWSPSYILTCPIILSFSLDKRILPRYQFLQVLVSKGLIKKNKKFTHGCFLVSEKQFLKNYAMKYEAKFPDILKVYKGIFKQKGLTINDGKECKVLKL